MTKMTYNIILILLVGAVLTGLIAGAFFALTHDLPQIQELKKFRPSAVTRVFSSDQVLLAEFFIEKRDPVEFYMIPPALITALITTEDRNFYSHGGLDLKGILRAIYKDIMAGKFVEGASTLTQQLAKTLFLTSEKTIFRKMKEAILAVQLERRYTKDEILTLYLNQVYFGSGAYGVASAASLFFDKSLSDLTLSECALIAGMPKSPSRYSPLVNFDKAIRRRDIVLKQMVDTGAVSAEQYNKALNEPLRLNPSPKNSFKAPYFIEYIKPHLEEILGSTRLYKGGLTIKTTLLYKLQQLAEKAVLDGLKELESRLSTAGTNGADAQAALVCLDVKSGAIHAMVGGKNFFQSAFNRVTSAKRQPGSAFKPIVYAAAIEAGVSQNSILLDAPVVFKGAKMGNDWRPENFSKQYLGEITLRKAMTQSKNIPAVRLIEKMGPYKVIEFARAMGITSKLGRDLSLALGTSSVTLIEMTTAYSVFANQGKYNTPYGIEKITDQENRTVWRHPIDTRIAMSREGAAIMTDMLQGVIQEGTGRKARSILRPVAGKTGTTNEYKDALFIGFSPNLATGVWVGRDVYESLGYHETGAKAALPIWMQFMQNTFQYMPPDYFDMPDGVIKIRINSDTGRKVLTEEDGVDVLVRR
jgi:penicillin-binding protein 1A